MSFVDRFDERCQQILFGLWEEEPVEATALGIHTFDALLSRSDVASRAAYHDQRGHFLSGLQEFEQRREELDLPRQLDLDLLSAHLENSLYADDHFRIHERSADRYPSEALYGVYLLLMRESLSPADKLKAVCGRLRETPRLLAEGRANLLAGENIPAVWTRIGMEITVAGIAFFEQTVPAFAQTQGDAAKELLAALPDAVQALKEFGAFLQNELLQRSTGSFAIGEEAFDYLLNRKHFLPYAARELREIGNQLTVTTQRELEHLQHVITLGKSWREIIEVLKADHPAAERLLDEYRDAMAEARAFVETKSIATIPQDQSLQVVETPAFQRGVIPYAAFIPPAPFEESQDGIFWVTPIDKDAPAETQAEQLAGHSRWGIPVTALHEAYPGHHLQFCRANRVDSPVRRMLGTSVFIEGWALYCEEMMLNEGFHADPRVRMMQLKDQLWRACRVVIDVGLHCFDMSFEAAVSMLVSVADLEYANAVAEVKRYTQTPTQPMSYLIGKGEILALRDAVKAAEGDKFSLCAFHDRLLSYGSIPVSMVRRAMLEE